jgi:hypothetical protein
MKHLFAVLFLVMAVGCGDDGFDTCDPDEPNLPVGGAVNSNYLHRCEFTRNLDWENASGGTQHHYDGERFWDICDDCNAAFDTCRDACLQLATNYGVPAAGLNAACGHVATYDETESPEGSSCEYKRMCEADEFPLPTAMDPPEPPDPGDPTFYCVSDLSLPQNTVCPTADVGAVWGRDEDGLCASQSPTTPCGFPVYGVPLGDDPDQQCQDLCPSLFLHPISDADPENSNCDTFVQAEVCESHIAPGLGNEFTWQTTAGTTESPLACTGACCGEFGMVACANVSAKTVISPIALRHAQLSLPVQFTVGGVTSKGTVVGTVAYSVTSCQSGQTCPLYLESLELHTTSTLTGTWVDSAGQRRTFRVSNLSVRAARPAIGGFRPSGQLQLRAHTLDFEVRATVDARSMGLPITTLDMMAGNTQVITGRLSASTFSIATAFDLQGGSRLVIGTP